MRQPDPQGGEQPPAPARPGPPRPVRTAVLLMYVGAAITAITLVVTLLTIHSIETTLENKANYTPQQAHQFVVATIVAAVVTLGLWLLMAWANRNGYIWGRMIATILFALNTVDLVVATVRGAAALSLLFAVVIWLIGLAAIVLLWRKESGEYFATPRPPRPPR